MEVVFFFLGLLVAIPLGIFTNILTPKVESLMQERAVKTRGKTKKALLSYYSYLQSIREHPQHQNLWFLFRITVGLFGMAGLIMFTGIIVVIYSIIPTPNEWYEYILLGFIIFLFLYSGYMVAGIYNSLLVDMNNILRFDKYRQAVIRQLEKLGVDPDVLDEEMKE